MAQTETTAGEHDARMVHRLLFFSDAVFAIVLTLLALELRFPHLEEASEAAFWAALLGMSEHFAAFLMSFALVGLWWLIHMRSMRKLVVFDWLTAVVNLFALGCITLIPFAASVFGAHLTEMPGLMVYWLLMAAASLSMTLLFLVVTRGKGRLIGGIAAAEWWSRLINSLAPTAAFVAGAYFAATGQEWPARFAAFIMFPIMMFASLIYRKPKPAKA